MRLLRSLLNLLPHDTLMIGGQPYMHRWYLFGYAPPTPCRRCDVSGEVGGHWCFTGEGLEMRRDWVADTCPVCDGECYLPRRGWRWQHHGIGAVRLHQIVASDDSRAYHDHPWPFVSILLRGCYLEESPHPHLVERDAHGTITRCPVPGTWWARRRTFRAPAINHKAAAGLHVLAIGDSPVWSLFLTRPKQRSWGFAGPFGWLGWRAFDKQFPERDAWTET